MRAVPSRDEVLLRRLEQARHQRPGAKAARRALADARRFRAKDAEGLIRFHEALLFLRAYPHDARVRDDSERLLRTVAGRVRALDADSDSPAFDAPEVAGIAGTTIGTDYSFDVVRFLAKRFPRSVRLEWDAGAAEDRMRATWPEFLPLLEEEALADANVPYLDWLDAAAGDRRSDPGWLLERYASLPYPPDDRAERFDTLQVPVAWDLGDGPSSRTRMRIPGPAPYFHDEPFLARRDVSLDAILSQARLPIRRLSRRDGKRICDRMREATAARYREFYTFTYADPGTVLSSRPGRGVELFLVGVEPSRRLPLRSAYGGFVVKNGVPIGYIEGLALAERLEIGFNMYYTFREGESAWIYAQVLRMHRDALGVTSFSIDPYQLGYDNDEALDSGAFWFYRKLGFRPTRASVRRLLEREERRIAAEPSYRSSRRTLEQLVVGNLIYDAPGSRQGEWDRFHVRNIGLEVNRNLRKSGRSAARFRRDAETRVARTLGTRPENSGFFLALSPIPDLARWSARERKAAIEVARAKPGRDERRYLALLRGHARLRAALLRLGSSRRA